MREPGWYEHRMFKTAEPQVNLHVFSRDCAEVERMLIFRNGLRGDAADRELYARMKLALSQKRWERVQDYADAKTTIGRRNCEAGAWQSKINLLPPFRVGVSR